MHLMFYPVNPGGGPSGDLLRDIRENKANPRAKLAVAKGLIPLDPKILGEVLLTLVTDQGEDIRTAAKKTLSTLPESVLYYISDSATMSSKLLDNMARIFAEEPEILQRIALNRITADETIDYIASLGNEKVLDIIAGNQARMIQHPKIMNTLLQNPSTSQATRIRLEIYKKELIEQGVLKSVGKELLKRDKASAVMEAEEEYEEEVEEEAEEEVEEEEEIEEEAEAEPGSEEYDEAWKQEAYEESLEEVVEEEVEEDDHVPVAQRIANMTVAEKLVLARHADKQERSILIRDSNKQVSLTVIKSPKISDSEVEMIARMRNVSEEVIREVANNREWVKNMNVVVALLNNPKTPIGVSLQFITKAQNKDLRDLANNRNVSETLRTAAKRMLTMRTQRTGGPKPKKH